MYSAYSEDILVILIFGIFGIALTTTTIKNILRYNKYKDVWDTVEAEITNIYVRYTQRVNIRHDTEITYTHNEMSFTRYLGFYSSNMRVGQTLTILVNPKNSEEIIYAQPNKFLLIFSIVWDVATLISIVNLFFTLYQ